MAKLKLGPIVNYKPVKVALSLPSAQHRDLVAYAEVLERETGEPVEDSVKLIVTMLERFIATDQEFAKACCAADGAASISTFLPAPRHLPCEAEQGGAAGFSSFGE